MGNLNSWAFSTSMVMTMLFLLLISSSYFGVFELNMIISNNYIMSLEGCLILNSYYFMLSITIISMMVMLWARFYMWNTSNPTFFFIVLFLFVVSMMLLTLSNSFMFLFLGWEGLGLTSYLLIIFYQNWMSHSGGLLTLLTNRIGDALLLIMFSYWISMKNIFYLNQVESIMLLMTFLFLSFTKSAQVPFTSWLPAAMAAPTPVSALVHSSTLVTAGVWLLIRFSQLIMMNYIFMLMVGTFTLVMASLAALLEFDGKKLVALSTLSQLGLMITSISMGGPYVCLFHLISHAFAKANLFIMVGNLIHFKFSSQDSRMISFENNEFSILLMMMVSMISLSGVMFLSGFFSKETLLLFNYFIMNSMVSFILLMSVVSLTLLYFMKLTLFLLDPKIFAPMMQTKVFTMKMLPSLLMTTIIVILGYFVLSNFIGQLWKNSLSGLLWMMLLLFILFNYFQKNVLVNFYILMSTQTTLINLLNYFLMSTFKRLSIKMFNSFLDEVYLMSTLKMSQSMNMNIYMVMLIMVSVVLLLMM